MANPQLRKIGVLLNPASGRLKKNGSKIRELASKLPGSIYREGQDAAEIESILRSFASEQVDTLVVVSGDGTFHLVLSVLLRKTIFTRLPVFVLIPAGTTNMTAKDFGSPSNPVKALHALSETLAGATNAKIFEKPVLGISHGDRPGIYGMFYATGLISEAVESFGSSGRGGGMTGEKASFATFLRYLGKLFAASPRGTKHSAQTAISINGSTFVSEPRLLVLASTLDRLLYGLKPYWGEGKAPMHVTIIKKSPARLWIRLLPLLFGRGGQFPEDGYFSEDITDIKMKFDGKYVVDGELYSASAEHGAVHITADKNIGILKLT